MGIFDDDYEEENESYQFGDETIEEFEEKNNIYLSSSDKALELISKVIGIEIAIKNKDKYKKLKELEKLFEKDFLKSLINY